MNMPRDKDFDYIQVVTLQFVDEKFNTNKLKMRLIGDFGEQFRFWQTSSKSELELGQTMRLAQQ